MNDIDNSACVSIKDLGVSDYRAVFADMQAYTRSRTSISADQIWFTEHAPVFTQGQAGKPEHVLAPGGIPVIQSDRGGQVTYHGLSLNVDMDLEPFSRINPCGLLNTTVTHMAAFRAVEVGEVKRQLLDCLASELRLPLAD